MKTSTAAERKPKLKNKISRKEDCKQRKLSIKDTTSYPMQTQYILFNFCVQYAFILRVIQRSQGKLY